MNTVVTHSGGFHPDDVFALAAFQLLLGKENVHIIRTRDEAVMGQAEYVVDVGGVYDHEAKRYDHHQNGAPVRENGIPYAGFGLMWRHYGSEITGSDEIAKTIDERLVQPIDAGDNGVNLYTLTEHQVAPYELYNVVGSFKPVRGSEQTDDEAFVEAVDFARELLSRVIAHVKAGAELATLIQSVYDAAEDKSILVFDSSVDRNSFVKFQEVNAVVYPSDDLERGRVWKVGVVPKDYNTFDDRVKFPASWAGLRDEELAAVSGIPDAIFCHKASWRFVARSKEGALAAARQAR